MDSTVTKANAPFRNCPRRILAQRPCIYTYELAYMKLEMYTFTRWWLRKLFVTLCLVCYPVFPCDTLCYPLFPCVSLGFPMSPCVLFFPLCSPLFSMLLCVTLCSPVFLCATLCYSVLPRGWFLVSQTCCDRLATRSVKTGSLDLSHKKCLFFLLVFYVMVLYLTRFVWSY